MDKNIYDLASEDTQLREENRNNNTWCGPCPNYPDKCDRGTDGFVVFMDAYDGIGGFSCRGCWDPQHPPILPDKPRLGDMIDYYRWFKGKNFYSAKQAKEEYLNEAVDSTLKRVDRVLQQKRQARNVPPDEQWQASRKRIIDEAVKRLRTPEGKLVLDYLHARGYDDKTIDACRFGAIHSSMVNAQYLTRRVEVDTWLVVIPWYAEGLKQLWKVELRDIRPDCPQRERYRMFTGSSNGLYLVDCLDMKRPTFIVEGMFDAAIIAQEAGSLVNVVATGSTSNGRISKWIMRLSRMPVCFLGQDNEPKGEEGAAYWAESLAHKNPLRWRPIGEKDVNAMHLRRPGFVRQWVEMALETWQEEVAETGAPAEVFDLASIASDSAAIPETEEETAESDLEESDYCACGVSVVRDDSAGGYSDVTYRYVCSQCLTRELQRSQCEAWVSLVTSDKVREPIPADWKIDIISTAEIRAMQEGAVSSFPVSKTEQLPANPGEYVPVSLAPLPRQACPHFVIYQVRDKDKKSGAAQYFIKRKKCANRPGASGWCAEHEKVAQFLDIGARLGYPTIMIDLHDSYGRKTGDREIPQGVIGWEETAVRLLTQIEIMKAGKPTKTRSLYSQVMPELEKILQ